MSVGDSTVLALCDEVWKWRLVESPELATFCGNHQFDDVWDDISEESYIKRLNYVQEFLRRAEGIDAGSCSPEVALSHTLLVDDLKLYLEGSEFKSYLMPINYLEGIHSGCNLTISQMKFENEEDFNKYISRLEKLPDRIDQVVTALKRGVDEGVVQHGCSVKRIPSQIESMVNKPLDELELLAPFKGEHAEIPKDKLDDFQSRAKDLIQKKVFPALLALKDYLEKEYFNNLRAKEGISALKDGDQWYQQCLNFHLSCSMTPQEVHDLGLSEVDRIKREILKIAENEGLGNTLPEILKAINTKQEKFFSSKEDVLKYVQDLCYNKIRPKISQLFKDLPESPVTIQASPDYMKDGPAGYYLNGTPDGSRQGVYYINNHNLTECLPYQLPALSLHEGEPGHHLQGVYAMKATQLPDFRRYCEDCKYYLPPGKFGFNTAYVEGWGLYSEALGEEVDVYDNVMDKLGRYNFEIFRATRLVVDTGLHAFGWTRDQAIQYMVDNTLIPESELTQEVERYITWPGQACAYKVGEIKIWELRFKAECMLGNRFDIKEFHHRVLSCGSVPLRVLEQVVDKYIAEVTAGKQ